ncbi:DUF6208 family protein [[Limnothrix rosea] IAM M-220]|uniref:DUF6208 family protein n=1 Tax=[Limnothrix rosea] IAM M-220 TaxID=454133 RepID=UPI0009605D8F|nr:DUF6208 family protein [[Limnothrix rosea] IAM M-220]OKH17075.1 hypothetical protein NIES208_10800 [[Limnothrix rosea] IAM M-220]
MSLKTWLEVPLAILSFGFYKVSKFTIGKLYTLYLSRNTEQSKTWRIISENLLKKPLSLSVLMTKAPRWNTHAMIGTLGPISVESELIINLDTIRSSTESWVGCIYDFPSYKTVTNFESLTDDPGQSTLKIKLPKGKYTVGLRYYHAKENIIYPVVTTDADIHVPPLKIESDNNDFYKTLASKKNWYFSWLHYYVFTILQLRHLLPESFVKYEFLPVGATDTQFFFGALKPDENLQIDIAEFCRSNYRYYLTFYNRASFPLCSQKLEGNTVISALGEEVYYLIRMRPNSLDAKEKMPTITGHEKQLEMCEKQLVIKSF